MKQTLLLLLLLPIAALSQHIQSDQFDAFGKSRRIATSRVEFSNFTTSLAGTATIAGGDTSVCMNLFFRAGKATFTDKKTKVLIQLENGETIQVFNQDNYKELTASEPGFIVFPLSQEEKLKLRAFKVTGYSIYTGRAAVQIDLSDRQQSSFNKTLHLLETQARSAATPD